MVRARRSSVAVGTTVVVGSEVKVGVGLIIVDPGLGPPPKMVDNVVGKDEERPLLSAMAAAFGSRL